jgi:hypothetical protein
MDDIVASFKDVLQRATAAIPPEYFRLKVAGADLPVFRERVYCYELYHQLRCIWPPNYPFTLGGEVDKSGHPIFRGGRLDRLKPDFLVHIPGDIEGNFVVIEVKPITARGSAAKEDMTSLNAFVAEAGYQLPILLVFGGTPDDLDSFKRRALAAHDQAAGAQPGRIELWWHAQPGDPASMVPW